MQRAPVIFVSADGLTCAMGIIAGLSVIGAAPADIWIAALSAGIAEFPGMASGQYQSAPERGKAAAALCGLASAFATVVPAVPYLFWSGIPALLLAVAVAAGMCTVIAILRPDTGIRAFIQSYGITAVSVLLCVGASMFLPH